MSNERAQTQELLNYQADRIEAILAAQGLDIHVVSGVVGPRLVVFHAVKPATVKLSAVMRMDEEIALGLGAPTCRIARNGYFLNIEIPRRDPATVRLMSLTPKAPGDSPPRRSSALMRRAPCCSCGCPAPMWATSSSVAPRAAARPSWPAP